MKTLRDEIKGYLAWKGIKAYHLADKADVSYRSIYQYLSGKADILLRNAEKIRRAMED